jgi:hypothetical protein
MGDTQHEIEVEVGAALERADRHVQLPTGKNCREGACIN